MYAYTCVVHIHIYTDVPCWATLDVLLFSQNCKNDEAWWLPWSWPKDIVLQLANTISIIMIIIGFVIKTKNPVNFNYTCKCRSPPLSKVRIYIHWGTHFHTYLSHMFQTGRSVPIRIFSCWQILSLLLFPYHHHTFSIWILFVYDFSSRTLFSLLSSLLFFMFCFAAPYNRNETASLTHTIILIWLDVIANVPFIVQIKLLYFKPFKCLCS